MEIERFIHQVIRHISQTKLLSAKSLVNLGVKDIHTYRSEISATMQKHLPDPKDQVVFFQLMMAQGNRKRLLSAIKLNPDLLKEHPKVVTFIEKHTCGATKDHKMDSICTLKVASSFPDICAPIHVVSQLKSNASNIHLSLAQQLWSGSLDFSDDAQAENRSAVMSEWNKWGKQNPNKKNSLGEQIKFDDRIYENAVNDKIRLMMLDGSEYMPGHQYTLRMLAVYIVRINASLSRSPASSTIRQTSPVTITAATPPPVTTPIINQTVTGVAPGVQPQPPPGDPADAEQAVDSGAVAELAGPAVVVVQTPPEKVPVTEAESQAEVVEDPVVDQGSEVVGGKEEDLQTLEEEDPETQRDFDDQGAPITLQGWFSFLYSTYDSMDLNATIDAVQTIYSGTEDDDCRLACETYIANRRTTEALKRTPVKTPKRS